MQQSRFVRSTALLLFLPLTTSLVSCSLLSSLTGQVSRPPTVGGTMAAVARATSPGAMVRSPGGLRPPLALSALAPGSKGLASLQAVAQRVAVPAAVLLARVATQGIVSHIARRAAERSRQRQANQLFYAGRCQLGAAAANDAGAGPAAATEAQAEAAFAQGDFGQAEALLARAVEQRQAEGAAGRPALARVLSRQSALYLATGQMDRAEAPAVRSLELREGAMGKEHPEVAESLSMLAAVYGEQSDFARAEPNLDRALKLRERALGADHICVAATQHQLAGLYQQMAAYGRAEPLYQAALTTRQTKLGADSLDVAESQESLGGLAFAMGNYAAADPYFVKALSIRRAKLGPEDPAVAESLFDLGQLQRRRGAYPAAEGSLVQALSIREKKLSPADPRIGESLTELAALYQDLGDYRAAEPPLLRALALQERALGNEHPDVAESLTRLAALSTAAGKLGDAESLLMRALSIREKKLGPNHPSVADSACDLGDLAMRRGDLARADGQYGRALAIRRAALGENHPQVAGTLHRQAAVLAARGDLRRAASTYEQALAARERLLGAQHPDVAQTLLGLGAVKVGLADIPAALRLLARARDANEAVLRSISGSGGASEERIDAFLRSLRGEEELTYSLLAEPGLAAREDVATQVATMALLRKGRSIDEAADTSRALYQGLGPEERQRLAALREVRSRRSDLALAGSGLYSGEEYQRMLRDLQAEEEKQQEALLRSSSTLRQRLSSVRSDTVLADVQKVIPENAALIEILAYHAVSFRPTATRPGGGGRPGPLRYGALIIPPTGKVKAVDLGAGEAMHEAVAALLGALTRTDSDWQPAARGLSARVLGPLAPALAAHSRWYLAPDGQLNLVPFSVLPLPEEKGGRAGKEGGGLLVERVDLSYLTSGRDMLRGGNREAPRTSVELLADPQFAVLAKDGEAGDSRSVEAARAAAKASGPAGSRGGGTFRGLRLGRVAPLPGTREEAKAIEKLLRKVEVHALYGTDAAKRAFLAIEQPGILHIATHGLFIGETTRGGDNSRGLVLDDEAGATLQPAAQAGTAQTSGGAAVTAQVAPSSSVGAATGAGPEGGQKPAYADNALLGSMLVLAGAETAAWIPPEQRDPALGNGLVTALEVASMNLWGTQLVVLSACETGRGDVSNLGQGVYGLRRAVMVAGAESLLTSLWKVDDKATRDLMARYYKNLLKGSGRADAMREAALYLRKKHPHPYYWAPFIAIGRAAPLAGLGKPAAHAGAEAADDGE